MKVSIRNHDIIDRTNTIDGIEIGSIPKGVGIERIRWNGSEIVDLVSLDEIWVEHINGVFILHSIEVPYSQLVIMQYKDRKKLWIDYGVYKIKPDEQIRTELNLKYRRSHYPSISDQVGAIMKYFALQHDLPEELQKMIDDIVAVKDKYSITVIG